MAVGKIILKAENDISAGLNNAKSDLNGFESFASDIGKKIESAFTFMAIIASLKKLAEGAFDAFKEFGEGERRLNQLKIALDNNDASLKNATDLIDKMKSMSLASKDDIEGLVAELASLGKSDKQIEAITTASVNLSNITGKDLNTSFALINATYNGTLGKLGNLIPELKNLTTEQLAAGEATDAINTKFGEMSEKLAENDITQKLKNLKDGFADLKENLGQQTATFFTPLIEGIQGLVTKWNAAAEAANTYKNNVDIINGTTKKDEGQTIQAALDNAKADMAKQYKAFADAAISAGYFRIENGKKVLNLTPGQALEMPDFTTAAIASRSPIIGYLMQAQIAAKAYESAIAMMNSFTISLENFKKENPGWSPTTARVVPSAGVTGGKGTEDAWMTIQRRVLGVEPTAGDNQDIDEFITRIKSINSNLAATGSITRDQAQVNVVTQISEAITKLIESGLYKADESTIKYMMQLLTTEQDKIPKPGTSSADNDSFARNYQAKGIADFNTRISNAWAGTESLPDTLAKVFEASSEGLANEAIIIVGELASLLEQDAAKLLDFRKYSDEELDRSKIDAMKDSPAYISQNVSESWNGIVESIIGKTTGQSLSATSDELTKENTLAIGDLASSIAQANAEALDFKTYGDAELDTAKSEAMATSPVSLAYILTSGVSDAWAGVDSIVGSTMGAATSAFSDELAKEAIAVVNMLDDTFVKQLDFRTYGEAEADVSNFDAMVDQYQVMLDGLSEAWAGAVDAGIEPIVGATTGFQVAILDSGDAFQREVIETTEGMAKALQPSLFSGLGEGLSGAWDTALSGLGSFEGALSGPMSEIITALGPFGNMLAGMSPELALLLPIIQGVVDVIGPALTEVIQPLMTALTGIGTAIGQAILPVLDAIAPIISIIAMMLTTGLEPLLQILSPILQNVSALISTILVPIIKALAIVFEILKSPVMFVADLFGWISKVIRTFGENIGVFLWNLTHWLNPKEYVKGPGEFSSDAFTGLQDRIDKINNVGPTKMAEGQSDSTTTTTVAGANYTGGNTITINIYQQAPIVGDNGMTEFARMIRRELIALDYYNT